MPSLLENIEQAGYIFADQENKTLDVPMKQAMYIGRANEEKFDIQIHGYIVAWLAATDLTAVTEGDYSKIEPYDEIFIGHDF